MANFSQPHICHCLTRLSTSRRNSIVTTDGNRKKTGEEFVGDVLSLASGLLDLGLRNSDIVAICAFNSDWYLVWLLAVAFVGAIVAPLNYRWSFEEAKSAMLSVKPVLLVSDESCGFWGLDFQSDAIPSLKWHVFLNSFSSGFEKASNIITTEMLRRNGIRSPTLDYTWAPEGAALICFTSGTTGKPKGVLISHSALIVQSLAKVAIVGYCEDDVYLHTTPLCHIGGLSSAMAMLMVGASHVLIRKFEAKLALEVIERHCVTSLITVPTMMGDLISLTRADKTSKGRQTVKRILNGGGSLPVGLIKDASEVFPRAKLLSAYGMTESCSSLTFVTFYDPTSETPGQHLHSYDVTKSRPVNQPQGVCVGKPAPHVELKICSNGSSDIGKILTRGPHAMLRYCDHNSLKTLDNANKVWLDTGDIGCIDNTGNLWLVGRTNNRIKSGGENVHPEEVEAILTQHPGVASVLVLGIPDPRLTEIVVACIKLAQGWQWSDKKCNSHSENELLLCSQTLQNHCRERNLSGFKVPKLFIVWRKPFPLTTTGKIRRDGIRREVISHLQCLPCKL
ncbi:2-succinylbenzoate--CoA ligase, chloroplastic/peroxisomal isoform X2 [Euphorbia lathyris]|uniref:2-succinylbenzoate--CoA ligase, chloroplastic/peroxisomal isoform X2 n=1 Tax=Euphorbia lathyris TaxID=212925 RepID=UPI00331326AE